MKVVIEPFLTNDEGEEEETEFTEQQKERFTDLVAEALLDKDNILEYLEEQFGKKDWYPDFTVESEE